MRLESTLRRLARSTNLPNTEEMRNGMLKRIGSKAFSSVLAHAEPPKSVLRQAILSRTSHAQTRKSFASVRELLSPPVNILSNLREEVLNRISTWSEIAEVEDSLSVQIRAFVLHPRFVKLTSAAVVFALLIRLTPALFIATPLQAESQNLLIPIKGFVAITDGAEWGPVSEQITLTNPITIRTGADSEATIVIRDDAVLRLSENTEINLRGVAFDPSLNRSIARIIYGQVWMTSLLPDTLPRETIVTIPQGTLTIKQGSINILADPQQSTIQVFHRSARVLATGNPGSVQLMQGDQLSLLPEGNSQRHAITNTMRSAEWTISNLSRDAVHRSEIAERKQDLAETVAGILPTSTFYSLKRASETVDLWFTLNENTRQEKQIRNAQTRLNEAVTLLKSGDNEAAKSPLAEYRESIKELTSITESEARELLTQSLIDSSETVSSALPHSELYVVKKAVAEMATNLETSEITLSQVDLYLLGDALLGIESLIAEGKIVEAVATFDGVSGAVASILDRQELGEVSIEKNELQVIKTILRSIAFSIKQAEESVPDNQILLLTEFKARVESQFPTPQVATADPEPAKACMTVREVTRKTNQFLSSVFTYQTPRAQRNEVLRQISTLPDCPQSGRVLSKVMNKVPVFTRSFVWEALQKIDTEI